MKKGGTLSRVVMVQLFYQQARKGDTMDLTARLFSLACRVVQPGGDGGPFAAGKELKSKKRGFTRNGTGGIFQ